MKKIILIIFLATGFSVYAQQINGVFTDFAKNNDWGNIGINSIVAETGGYFTLGGYYEGSQRSGVNNGVFVTNPNKYPLVMQINSQGVIRSEFGGGGLFLVDYVNSSGGSTVVDRTFIANTSSTANSNQIIIAGHETDQAAEDGFVTKAFPTGSRPTAFNNGNYASLSGGGFSPRGFIEDWHTGPFIYSIRINGATFGNARVLLSAFSKETYAPVIAFGDSGTLRINAPEGEVVNFARPARLAAMSSTAKFYVAFSTLASIGNGRGIALCRVNWNTGTIDSTFGSNGFKVWATASPYNITSLLINSDESITVGGYGSEGQESVPSFITFRNDGSFSITSFNYLLGEPQPGFGCKNIAAKFATINNAQHIVFAYAKPIDTDGHFSIAIATHQPGSPSVGPLVHTPWLGNEFVSAEPTSIAVLSNGGGFIVAGTATRPNGSFAGIALKYTISGTLDPAFGNQGVLIISGRLSGQQWNDAVQLSNEKYLAAGGTTFVPGNLRKSALLLNRFNSDGSIDENFGTNGKVYAHMSDLGRTCRDLFPLADGKFLIAGTYYAYAGEPGAGANGSGNYAALYKFDADGSPDNSFGEFNNGRFVFPAYPNMGFSNIQVVGNHIYMAASSPAAGLIMKVSYFGFFTAWYNSGLTLMQRYIVDEPTGYLYTAGHRNNVRAVSRIRPSGNLDSTFGVNGLANIPGINTGENGNINDIKLKANGGILATVQWTAAGNASYGIYFNSISSAGVVDMGFGTNGVKFLQLPGATSIIASRYKWTGQNEDSLLIFGQATVNGSTQGYVCKVDLNGDLVPTFGNNGVIWTTETFAGTIGFDNAGNALALKYNGFFQGSAIAKVSIPADVYNHIYQGSWTGAIDGDWFKPGNWAEGVVPGAFTEVVIANGNVLIGANQSAFAYNVRVLGGATLTMGANSTLTITENNP